MNRTMHHFLHLALQALLLTFSGLLIGCSLFGDSPSPEPPTSTATIPTDLIVPIPSAIPTIPEIEDTDAEVVTVEPETRLTETYRNTAAGYAFDYPDGWLVDGEGDYASLQNYRSQDLPPREVNDPDLYKIEFVWIRPGQAETVDEMLAQMRDGLDGSPQEITVNGLKGLRLQMSGFRGNVSDVLLLNVNERVLLVQSWQGGRLFDRITDTLRPIEGDGQ